MVYYARHSKHSRDSRDESLIGRIHQNYGTLADKALQEPVTITRNGRDRLVLISSEEYGRLRASYCRAFRTEELTDEDIELIKKQRVPEEYGYLDELLKDWEPGK